VQSNSEICGGNIDNKTPVLSARKKVYCLQNIFFVVIDRKIVDELQISQDDDIWVQQTLSHGGIFMKVIRNRAMNTG
jgi:hypothetical protein